MPCTFEDHRQAIKDYMAPAYVGVGLPNAYQPSWMNNLSTSMQTFAANMWNGYSNNGCQWWQARVNDWTSTLASGVNAQGNPINPYQSGLLNAKISYAVYMASICCVPILHPIVIPSTGEAVPLVEKLTDEEEVAKIEKLVDDLFVEYDKLDK